jgi:hypothetical protein
MITRTKVFQGKDYKKPGNPNRLNDYHVIFCVGKVPVNSMWIQGLDDWAKDNSFRGMTITKWDGTQETITDNHMSEKKLDKGKLFKKLHQLQKRLTRAFAFSHSEDKTKVREAREKKLLEQIKGKNKKP